MLYNKPTTAEATLDTKDKRHFTLLKVHFKSSVTLYTAAFDQHLNIFTIDTVNENSLKIPNCNLLRFSTKQVKQLVGEQSTLSSLKCEKLGDQSTLFRMTS